jgi:hypothetical protein
MALTTKIIKKIADLNLWFKIQKGDALTYADIPSIIPLRWKYIRDNWNFIKSNIEDNISSYPDPNALKVQLDDFSIFIESQRYGNSNPFE